MMHTAMVINNLMATPYTFKRRNDGISCTILDIVLLDRLNKLQDREAFNQLRLSAEITLL
jgi:hypothetical protein